VDRITESYLAEFRISQSLEKAEQSVLFEHFCNYCVISNYFNDTFDVEVPNTGVTEFGIDGIAILVNGNFVVDPEDVELLAGSRSSEVDFIFVQAKRASSLDTAEVLKFGSAAYDFFQSELAFSQGDKIHQLWLTKERVFERSNLFKSRNPRVYLHFCYTGRWSGDQNVDAARNASISRWRESNLFSDVEFDITGANDLQAL
jgi:archaellum component FlaF (FlaF/FlaG flagellin family)